MRTLHLILAASLLTFAGCQGNSDAQPTQAPADKKAVAKAEKSPAKPAVAKAKPAHAKPAPGPEYTVKIIPGTATAGQPAKSVIEVSPAAGFKINMEYPVQVKKLVCSADAKCDKTQFGLEDAERTEKLLRFTVPFTAAKAGKIDINGLADFSVCNENACKLIRDEKLAWAVDVH